MGPSPATLGASAVVSGSTAAAANSSALNATSALLNATALAGSASLYSSDSNSTASSSSSSVDPAAGDRDTFSYVGSALAGEAGRRRAQVFDLYGKCGAFFFAVRSSWKDACPPYLC